MKIISLLFFALFGANIITYGQDVSKKALDTKHQIEYLHIIDSLLLEGLPIDFSEYVALYGEGGPLCSSMSILEHLCHSENIDYDLFIKKVVDIAVGASPGVDHINYLKDVSLFLIQHNLRQVVRFLNSKTVVENTLFWAFVLGGIENRADSKKVASIEKELQNLSKSRFNTIGHEIDTGYRYPETVEQGYKKSEDYIIHHHY